MSGEDITKDEWDEFFSSRLGSEFLVGLGKMEQLFLGHLVGHTSFEDYKLYDGMLEGVRRVQQLIDDLRKGAQ